LKWNSVKNKKLEWFLLMIVVLAIIPIISGIVIRALSNNTTADYKIMISMGGFTPPNVEAKAGETVVIELVNSDNSMHSDGGGWHQLASDELGFDYRIAPESNKFIELKVDEPGEYAIYCDVCCGGKENPYMQGKIIVS